METLTFILFAGLALGSALVVVTHRNPVYATMSLVVTLVSVAAMFLLLGAPFLAALQILIYTGAIVVLFLFVIMLLNVGEESRDERARGGQYWTTLVAAPLLAGMMVAMFWRAYGQAKQAPLSEEQVSLAKLARSLFSEHMLPFQIIGLLLLAAVIAATVLARRRTKEEEEAS
jgi:NADH-quinone oxidoreductase subunit J